MNSLRRFLGDRRGVAAVEFAMVAPVMVAVVVLGFDGWQRMRQVLDMRTAVQTAARYYQTGGADDAAAQQEALTAWSARPTDGLVNVTRRCQCGSAVVACTDLCSGQALPMTYITITAASSYSGVTGAQQMQQQAVVRVR